MAFLIDNAPALADNQDIEQVPFQYFSFKPFSHPVPLTWEDLAAPEDQVINPLPSGPWPGANIDIFDVTKDLKKSSIAGVAYDSSLIDFLARSVQYFGELALVKIPQGQPRQGELVQLKFHKHYLNIIDVLNQWASFKVTTKTESALGSQLQRNQVRLNQAPAIDTTVLSQAALDVERSSLLRLAGRGRVGRGGYNRRGGRGGRSSRSISDA